MDDIDKIIDRAQIGKRGEVAYEIYKHPPNPKTDIKPLQVKRIKIPCQFSYCKHEHDDKLFRCRYCGRSFCEEHRGFKEHHCTKF